MKIKIKARLSFPDLFQPTQFQGSGPEYYGCQFLVEAGSESDKAIEDAIKQVATEKWKDKAPGVLKGINNNKQLKCYTDGDIHGYEENLRVLAAKRYATDGRPDVRDRDASPLAERDGKPYAGCYVVGIVDIWAQDNNFGKGVRAQLLGVQFLKDGEPFKKASKASDDDFEDLGVSEEDDMFA